MTNKQQVAVLALSGGVDSSTLLYYIKKVLGYEHVITVGIDYSQKHVKELCYAKLIAEKCNVAFFELNLTHLFSKGHDVLLKQSDKDISSKQEDIVVNLRNTIFLTCIAKFIIDQRESWSLGDKVIDIFYCPTIEDFAYFTDCRENFVDSISRTLNLGSGGFIGGVFAPFVDWTKKKIIELGEELSVPFELTTSCYKGEGKACGLCHACIIRIKGFKSAQIIDPITYNIDIDWENCKKYGTRIFSKKDW